MPHRANGAARFAATIALAVAGCAGGEPARAERPASAHHLYSEQLVARTLAAHPGVKDIRLYPGSRMREDDNATQSLIRTLRNSMSEPIGAIEVVFATRDAVSAGEADAVAHELARHIYMESNLNDLEPYDGTPPLDTYAQALVDEAVMRDDELITLAMHVAPPGGGGNIILASNFGRIGKPGDTDDAAVQATGKSIQEVTTGGRRLAVELPLLDARGAVIGSLSTSFRLRGSDQRPAVYQRAVALRDALARAIPSLQGLLGAQKPSTNTDREHGRSS